MLTRISVKGVLIYGICSGLSFGHSAKLSALQFLPPSHFQAIKTIPTLIRNHDRVKPCGA